MKRKKKNKTKVKMVVEEQDIQNKKEKAAKPE